MPPKLAILVSFSGQGGVERMIANLSQSLAIAPIDLDILLIKAKGPHFAALPDQANIIHLRARHSATSVFEVARYLRREKPDALLAIKHRGIIAALQARALARTSTPISGRLGTTVSAALAHKSSRRRARWFNTMRRYYPKLHRLIAVSQGVADDVISITGMPDRQVTVVRNPTVTPAMLNGASVPVEHPWFAQNAPPVVLGVGRLTEQKDFPTLLRAFAEVAKQRDARLVILGEGQLRETLLEQSRQLGIADKVAFPGFTDNPWAWMHRAAVFVLSSRWEGSPNTLTEALALGTPVVSTDCPSGPRELLSGGSIAPLVPMGDITALSEAILSTLSNPPEAETLIHAVKDYHQDVSAMGYLDALGLTIG
jgi:glycosyltransferase involved in cell wall biosynthesis